MYDLGIFFFFFFCNCIFFFFIICFDHGCGVSYGRGHWETDNKPRTDYLSIDAGTATRPVDNDDDDDDDDADVVWLHRAMHPLTWGTFP